ncbi:hypothetical protein [Xanthomonas sacchari]|nr:hypothetical protein [Xanthomonas sacchari]MDV0436690.1 hypothetical protein [Xanthomonas sacchari]
MRWFLLGQRTIRLFFRNVKHRKKKESICLMGLLPGYSTSETKEIA